MLVEGCAIEAGESPIIFREVSRNPVYDNSVSCLMEAINEVSEVIRCVEAGRGSVIGRHLVSPRSAERMLCNREKFDVCESGVIQVADEFVSEFPVALARFPGTQMNFIDAHRLN